MEEIKIPCVHVELLAEQLIKITDVSKRHIVNIFEQEEQIMRSFLQKNRRIC